MRPFGLQILIDGAPLLTTSLQAESNRSALYGDPYDGWGGLGMKIFPLPRQGSAYTKDGRLHVAYAVFTRPTNASSFETFPTVLSGCFSPADCASPQADADRYVCLARQCICAPGNFGVMSQVCPQP